MPIITLTTDYGPGSPFVAAMKGVIYSIDAGATIVDIAHNLSYQDITRGAKILEDATPWFPKDTIHVAVVDPGVGAARPIFYARIGSQHYLAPDNGLLGRLMSATRPSLVLRLAERGYWLPEVSHKFLGRDIMAPVAVRLSQGLDPRQLGPVATHVDQPGVKEKLRGEVMSIDSFGNLVTNILADQLVDIPFDNDDCCIACGIYEAFGIHATYGGHPPGMLVAVIGSSGRLELAVVGDSAAERTAISIGTPVIVAWSGDNR